MTNTNYELTIGGKLRKVYKNSGGFFVKMNGGNLNVNNYFLKNGSGLKSKYKTKGGDANEKGVFDNLVNIKFPDETGNPVTIMVNSIIDHLNIDIKNLKKPFSAEKIIMFIYYKLFSEANQSDINELDTLIEYVLFSLYEGYESLKIDITDIKNKMNDKDKINTVINQAITNEDKFNKKNQDIEWINNLFNDDGNFKTTKAAKAEKAVKEEEEEEERVAADPKAAVPEAADAEATDADADAEAADAKAANAANAAEDAEAVRIAKEAKAAAAAEEKRLNDLQTKNLTDYYSYKGGKNKNKNKVSSKNYLKKKLSNNKK
jgi:hypothetical protein